MHRSRLMRILLIAIISAALGGFATYLYIGKTFQVINQMAYESQINNHIRYVELIDDEKIGPLRDLLTSGIDCDVSLLNKFIESGDWAASGFSESINQKAAKYYNPNNDCHKQHEKIFSKE